MSVNNKERNMRPIKGLASSVIEVGIMALATIFTAYMIKKVLHPHPPETARKKLAKELGVHMRQLPLNEYELAFASKVIPPSRQNKLRSVAGCHDILDRMRRDISFMQNFPAQSSASMLACCKGVLLYGPPGTGKTMLAKAFASAMDAYIINVTASTLMSKWLGDSNKLCNALFSLASKISRCGKLVVVFIDEVDALLGNGAVNEHEVTTQVRTEFIQLWEGTLETSGVIILGATNRPDRLSDAVWRRFSAHFEVGMPNAATREEIISKRIRQLDIELVNNRERAQKRGQATRGVHLRVGPALLEDGARPSSITLSAEVIRAIALSTGHSEAFVAQSLREPMRPAARAAALADGYSGSDLVEVVRSAIRTCWKRLLDEESSTDAEENGSPTEASSRHDLREKDLLVSIAEIKAAATTRRTDNSRFHGN